MMRTNDFSKAFFGSLLWDDRLMQFLFMDEAGISAHEPVTIVVAIIANADEHIFHAERLIDEILGGVPDCFRENFVFSAKTVFGSKTYQDSWSLEDRLRLLKGMMSVPKRIGMPVCLSTKERTPADCEVDGVLGLTNYQMDHVLAFADCICVADRHIRQHCGDREVAAIVAEEIPEMRKFLEILPKVCRENPFHIPPDMLRRTVSDEEAGYLTQSGEMRVSRIRNSVHFVKKSADPLVQVADACAYGFRRFFAKQSHGADFARAILGDETALRNFGPGGGTECYRFGVK